MYSTTTEIFISICIQMHIQSQHQSYPTAYKLYAMVLRCMQTWKSRGDSHLFSFRHSLWAGKHILH